MSDNGNPLHVFRFQVDFYVSTEGASARGSRQALCSGRFSQCSGLEATMDVQSIKVGGGNYGAVQRAGRVNFATVVLRRGLTRTDHLWRWFELLGTGAYAYRLDAEVSVLGQSSDDAPTLIWTMRRALPTKFRAAELDAKSNEVGVEELQFVHEGLSLEMAGETSGA